MSDAAPRGKDLFIVDNSVSGWTGLRYLEEWAGIAKGFDIATGCFEIGALLALHGRWQALEKFRIEDMHLEYQALVDARNKVRRHIKNTYLKRIDAPVGVRPGLRCWTELNGD